MAQHPRPRALSCNLNWQVEITGQGGTYYYGTFNHALEISCLNGGTISDAKITSSVSGVSPSCNLLDSSLSCKQASSAASDRNGNVVNVLNALFSFTCSGNSQEELVASATMAAQYIDVITGYSATTTASHFLTMNILDLKGNADSSDSRCPSENWNLSSDFTTWLCGADATCFYGTCTLTLPSLTISQGYPIASAYIQST